MWEIYLISICFHVYAVPVHLDWFISFGGWEIWSHSFQVVAAILKPCLEQNHWVLFLITLKNSLILSTELCISLRIPFSPSCPELIYHLTLISKVSCVILQCSKCYILLCLSLPSSLSPPIIFKSNKPVFWPLLLRPNTLFHFFFI